MADKDDFFEEEKVEEAEVEQPVEKIKLGEDEYTQEELNDLVGLGKIAREAEDKYNRPIRKFWPEYTKQNQELSELREKLASFEAQNKQTEVPTGALTQEQKAEVKKQIAEILGDEPLTKKEFDQFYANRRQAETLLGDVQAVVSKAETDGLPKTSVEELLTYMDENGIRNPEKAYKLMFEEQIDKIKEAKLAGLKPSGLVTQTVSNAGSKTPPPPEPVTSENLTNSLRAFLRTRQG